MKKSELIEIIKEEIQNVLSEDSVLDEIDKEIYNAMIQRHSEIRAAAPPETHSGERIHQIISQQLSKWANTDEYQNFGMMRKEIKRIIDAGIKNKFDFSKPAEKGRVKRKGFRTTTNVRMINYPFLIINSGNKVLQALAGIKGVDSKTAISEFSKLVKDSKNSGQIPKQQYNIMIDTLQDKSKELSDKISLVTKQMAAIMKQK